ncbi:hypothetical protein [[Actinomadura] parvosata]|uniref:hypothetical protein n=1 Tax=[Actinomadura] parvosata TaxID=1955412 RepID=UPI003B96DC07
MRNRRLDEARRPLAAPHPRMTITDITAHWQLPDSGHFARASHNRYAAGPPPTTPRPPAEQRTS